MSMEEIYRLTEVGGFVITIIAMIVGMGKILFQMGSMAERFELIGSQQAKEIEELKNNVQALGVVLIKIAETDGRLGRYEERQLAEGKRIDEITSRMYRVERELGEVHRLEQ